MAENRWFSFFKEGVELLGHSERKFPVELFSGKPKNALWNRHIALQKAKVARAEKNLGHGVPFFKRLYGRAFSYGHGALSQWHDALSHFLQATWLFFSFLFRKSEHQRAMAAQALQWLQGEATKWQDKKWYAVMCRQLQQAKESSKPRGNGRQGPSALASKAQRQSPLVDPTHQEPRGTGINNKWCFSISPSHPSSQANLA